MNQHLAIYLRLSLEDMDVRTNKIADESNSIKSQRLLVHNYIESHPELSQYPIVEYVDATDIIGLKQNPTNGRRFSPIFSFIGHLSERFDEMLLQK